MVILTQGKGGKRQLWLIIIMLVLAVIVGIYVYSSRRPARPAGGPAPAPAAPTERARVPEAKPLKIIRPEELSSERINEITTNLGKLDLVLHGKLPVKVDPKEVGRANPFIAP